MAQTRVAFVGDDDQASVALLRLASPEQLLLLDIDERIITRLHNEANRLGEDGMTQFIEVVMALAAYTGELHIAVPAVLAEAWTDELLHSAQSRLVAAGFLIDRVVPGAFTCETSDVVSSLVVARRLPGGPARCAAEPDSVTRFYTTRTVPERTPLLSHCRETECEP